MCLGFRVCGLGRGAVWGLGLVGFGVDWVSGLGFYVLGIFL